MRLLRHIAYALLAWPENNMTATLFHLFIFYVAKIKQLLIIARRDHNNFQLSIC
jgi:hypothetical protein